VAEATRARVSAEAARIGYRPNATARRLRSGRSDAVGVVLPNRPGGQLDDPYFMRLLTGLGMHLARLDLDMVVTAAPQGVDEMKAYRRLVEAKRVDAFIIGRTRVNDARVSFLLDQGVPFVSHGRTGERRLHAFLDIDGQAAFAQATQRLIGFGHRRIALLNGPESYMFTHHREAGWRAALAVAGLPEGVLLAAEPSEENGFRLARIALDRPDPPTALLCGTDRLAIGALHALSLAGLRAGRDVSVIGYDDLPGSVCANPPLTTMDQMLDQAAARVVEMLAALLGGASPATQREIWQARLVPRQSDGPLASDRARDAPPQPAPPGAWDRPNHDQGGLHDQRLPPD
jgi:LacI family transcriptional regulator